jgi:hypothetical protein
LMYDDTSDLKSVCGTRMSDTRRQRAAFAVASATVLPAMPIWLGTQTNVMVKPELRSWCRRSRMVRISGFLRSLLSMDLMQESGSEQMRKSWVWDWLMMSRARFD